MANTYVLLNNTTLGSTQSAITFSSISNAYTDLRLKCSVRTTAGVTVDNIFFSVNGSSVSYLNRMMYGTGNGGNAVSSTGSTTYFDSLIQPGANSTANTFGYTEFYLPNYAGSTNKTISVESASENNGTAWLIIAGGVWNNTTAINSVTITAPGGSQFVIGSSMYLYGIKNS